MTVPSRISAVLAASALAVLRGSTPPEPLMPLTQAQAGMVLPREMALLTPKLPVLYEAVTRQASRYHLEGWPAPWAPFAADKEHPADPFRNLHPTIRRIWANVHVLWIHLPQQRRWDALLLMKIQDPPGTRTSDDPGDNCRLMWLRDAFGSPQLRDAESWGRWSFSDVLEWIIPGHEDTTLTYARTLKDLQRSWAYTLRNGNLEFSCGITESDDGQSYGFDPDLGLGHLIEDVSDDPEVEGSMGIVLSTSEFRTAKVVAQRDGRIWVRVRDQLATATSSDWKKWQQTPPAHGAPQP